MVSRGETALELTDDLRKVERSAKRGKKAVQLVDEAEEAVPKGGAYVLRDPETGQVMRTGRTKDHYRREQEHKRQSETESLRYKPEMWTDDYAAQRGHEQLLHDEHRPPLDKIRPISP